MDKNKLLKILESEENVEKILTNLNGVRHTIAKPDTTEVFTHLLSTYGEFHTDEDLIKYSKEVLIENAKKNCRVARNRRYVTFKNKEKFR